MLSWITDRGQLDELKRLWWAYQNYEAACKIHQRDLQNLSRIIALEKKNG